MKGEEEKESIWKHWKVIQFTACSPKKKNKLKDSGSVSIFKEKMPKFFSN